MNGPGLVCDTRGCLCRCPVDRLAPASECWLLCKDCGHLHSARAAEEARRRKSTACPCGGDGCAGPDDGERHQCGGPREACGVAGCRECGAIAAAAPAAPTPAEARETFERGLAEEREQAEPASSLADAVIAALREIKPGRLADPWRVEQRGAERWAERSRGGMTEALWEEPGGPTLEEQMAQSDDRLRTAGYHITEDVIRAAVAEYAAKENQR